MLHKLDAKGRRHGIGGDVVMGGADTAGGDHIVIAGAQGVQRRHDLVEHIGHRPRLGQLHPMGPEIAGDVAQVGVAGATRQDFVADDQHGGGHPAFGEWIWRGDGRGCHVHLTFCCRMSTRAWSARKRCAPSARDLSNPV